MLIDTHCHIHDSQFFSETRSDTYSRARAASVEMICVGTSEEDSMKAVEFAAQHDDTWAVVGVHPHDTKAGWQSIRQILERNDENVIGVGEIGLDYFYDNSPRDVQVRALEEQLQWAMDYNLPVSFHVREASSPAGRTSVWHDFWPIFDNFSGARGVLHSFTDTEETLEKALSKGLYVGVNGISTFARDKQSMWDMVPLERMLLETDAPFLTPVPYRGKVNEPAFMRNVAEYHADRRGITLETIAEATTANAKKLFRL